MNTDLPNPDSPEVALVQIGAEQQAQFITWAERELLPALRSL